MAFNANVVNIILVLVLLILCVGAGALAFFNYITEERQTELRRKAIMGSGQGRKNDAVGMEKSREAVAKKIKQLEEWHKNKEKLSISQKIQQAGITISEQQFYVASAVSGVVVGLITFAVLGNIFVAAGVGIVAGATIGQTIVNTMRQGRLDKFFNDFPNALDVIVRGVSAGLPLIDCLRVIANDSEEPIRSEVAGVLQATTLGLSLPEALVKMSERVPIPETSFFAVVITIQQKSGGNLAEALANLSRVIRDRKKLRAKADALATEAKTMAKILGALPFLVFFANYYINPDYIEPLYTTSIGRWAVFGCFVWMAMGALIIRKMIRFDI